jgi:NAD(P)-dependent dehydrogenase (short-subunit alcohol dehydrogenase family)
MHYGSEHAKQISTVLSILFKVRQPYSYEKTLTYCVIAVANVMKEQRPQGGSIIGISSISALVGGAQQVYGLLLHSRQLRPLTRAHAGI